MILLDNDKELGYGNSNCYRGDIMHVTAGAGGGYRKFIIDVTKLGDVSDEVKDVIKKLTLYNEKIYKLFGELGDGWKGPSYDAFIAETNSFKSEIEEIPTLFSEYDEKVGFFSSAGGTLISEISQLVNIGAASAGAMAGAGGGLYSLHDTSFQSARWKNSLYFLDIYNCNNARDVKKQAQDIQSDLWNDIEVLDTELMNIEINKSAILELYNDGKISEAEYKTYYEQLETQRRDVENCRAEYQEAYDTIQPLFKDKLFGFGTDGAFIEASDWFGNDMEMASNAAVTLNSALSDLDPVYAYCNMSSLNGLPAASSDAAMRSFNNGPNVSDVIMSAAYTAADGSGETMQMPNNSNVVLFNSQSVILDGMESSGYIYGNSNYTMSQNDAYGAGGYASTYEGYDSVAIKDGDSTIYMTYNQYVNSEYNPDYDGSLE